MHEVGLAQSDAAVDEQWVVRPGRGLGDGPAGGMGELVRRADDEGVEGVTGIQTGGPPGRPSAAATGNSTSRGRGRGIRGGRREHAFLGRLLGVGLCLGHERESGVRPADLGEGVGQHTGVVLEEPVAEDGVGNPDGDALPVVRTNSVGETTSRNCVG